MHTAIDAAADALLTAVTAAVQAAAFDPQPAIDLGFPAGGVQDEHVWVAGDVGDDQQSYRVSALTGKDETFSLRVHVVMTSDSDSFDVPRDRAKILTDAIEAGIQANPTLAGTVMLADVSGVEVDEAIPSMSRRQVMRTLTIACQAWLTP